ncbi:MAG: oligogalacturonate lyase family protein [Verrucomicrobiota bacterium]
MDHAMIAKIFRWPVLLFSLVGVLGAADVPKDWIDKDTGHRIIRLSEAPGSESLYFHQNAFTAAGDKMVMVTPDGIATVDFKTWAIDLVVPGVARSTNISHGIIVGRESRQVYYVQRDAASNMVAYVTHLDTRATREIGRLPGRAGSVLALNADESLLVGSIVDGPASSSRSNNPPLLRGAGDSKGVWMQRRFHARIPMQLFTLEVKTGRTKTFHPSTDWLNHVQCSPTDPSLILFCHEGPWHLLDRTWLIRADGGGLRQVHPRTMEMEIAGHEFFSADGRMVWYDLQTPRGEDFWLAGYEIATGARTWYHLQRDEWSVHYNVSRDGSLFAGDGGDEGQVAHARDGKWIYLFRPERNEREDADEIPNRAQLIKTGVFRSEKLVNMANHDYSLEPNVNFSPDGKWIVFRSNMFGPAHVFAVAVDKSAR